MDSAAETAAPLDALLAPLLHRPPAERLEAIARLAQSLQPAAPVMGTILDFAGAWADMPGTDEYIIAAVQAARNSTRPEVSLD